MCKILILGSNSFSGSSFVNFLHRKTDHEIFCISRSPEPILSLSPHKWHKKKYSFFSYHLVDNFEEIVTLIKKIKPKMIFNYASQSMVAESWLYPDDWFNTNTLFTIKLHNILKDFDFLDRYIHISTPEVYGNCEGKINENYPYNPTTPYAVSRAASDMSLKTFNEAYKFPFVGTRAANVYGPGQQLYRIIPKTIISILKNKKIPLHGGGKSDRSFIYIDDVSNATLILSKHGEIGNFYHISTNKQITIRNLVELICKKMNVNIEDYIQIDDERLGKDKSYNLSSEKIKKISNWYPEIDLEKGIEFCINWALKYKSELLNSIDYYEHKR